MGSFGWRKQKNVYLCPIYVRKKHNRSDTTSVVVVSKACGKYKEIKSFGSSSSEEDIESLCNKAVAWIRSFGGQHTYSGAYPFSIPWLQSAARRAKKNSF